MKKDAYPMRISKFLFLSCCVFTAESKATEYPLTDFRKKHIENKLSLFNETIFYSWRRENGNEKGRQVVIPWTLTYNVDNFYFGVRRAYIDSENLTPGNRGRVTTWSDTSLSAAYSFDWSDWYYRLSFDYNLPNGKATLNREENNAIMDGYLVWQTQFGEGENYTPGINITRALGDKSSVGAGISYSQKGKYDPNSESTNDVIDPGDEIVATAQWSYRERLWNLNLGVIGTKYGMTQRDGIDYYRKGTRINYQLGGAFAFPQEALRGLSISANTRYSKQSEDENYNPALQLTQREQENSNADSLYVSLGVNLNRDAHNFSISGDLLRADKNSYLFGDINHDAGKSKRSVGVGYSYRFADHNARFNINLKTFSVTDKSETAGVDDTKYKGENISFNFSYNF